jgi:NTE family protein
MKFVLISVALALSASALGQTPRIGLALSGGGARGAAHLGVLKVLEELHVPVSCVAGTSMGSVIGGSYAAGTSPRDMEEFIKNTDWDAVFSDRPPRGEISPRLKRDDYKGLFAPEFGVRGLTLLAPKGVVSGVQIESAIRGLTQQSAGIEDFSKLPIPFRAVATDIETGAAVVLDHGNLARAMRASMAIPGVMRPVEIDGRLLVDGASANNLPIDVVRKLCGDVLIVVDISTPPLERKDINSAVSVFGQLMNLQGKESVDRQLATLGPRDVLIRPQLGDISSGSFTRMEEAIAIGEAAARSQAELLRRYALPAAQYEALRKRQERPRDSSLGRIDEIRFEGIERTNSEILLRVMEIQPGEEVTEEQVAKDLRRIYGRGDFESVDYRIEQGPDGSNSPRALVIMVHEKDNGPNYLRFGLSLASERKSDSYFNILASYRATWLTKYGTEWKLETQVGHDSYAFTELYQPLTRYGYFFVAPYLSDGLRYRSIFSNDHRVAEYWVREARGGVDLGTNFGQWGELRIGPVWRNVRAGIQTGSPALPDVDTDASGLRVQLFGDRLDEPWFPREGDRLVATGFRTSSTMGADQQYSRGELSFLHAESFGAHTFQFGVAGGSNFGTNLPAYDSFLLGGPFRLSGYAINQFSGQQDVFGSVRYLHQLTRLPSPLGSGAYFGVSAEGGRVNKLYDGRDTTGNLWSSSGFIGANTFLGPAWLGVGFAPGGNKSLFILIGVL